MSFKYHVDKRHVFVDKEPVLMYFIFRWSDYLIAEECHPVLFELDIVNPEVLPDESIS